MTKTQRSTILKRLGGLVPDVERICEAYEVDQKRAKKIQRGMKMLMQLFLDLMQLMSDQEEFIKGQKGTATIIEGQVNKEKDARTLLGNIEVFTSRDHPTVRFILDTVFTDVFAEEFGHLEDVRQVELFASLRNSVNSLKRKDNILVEP